MRFEAHIADAEMEPLGFAEVPSKDLSDFISSTFADADVENISIYRLPRHHPSISALIDRLGQDACALISALEAIHFNEPEFMMDADAIAQSIAALSTLYSSLTKKG